MEIRNLKIVKFVAKIAKNVQFAWITVQNVESKQKLKNK